MTIDAGSQWLMPHPSGSRSIARNDLFYSLSNGTFCILTVIERRKVGFKETGLCKKVSPCLFGTRRGFLRCRV